MILLAGIPLASFVLIFTTNVFQSTFRSLCTILTLVGVACSVFCMAMDRKTRRKWWFYIGALSLAAIACGHIFGGAIMGLGMKKYLEMTQNNFYSNVLPTELAAAHTDAGVIQFASSAIVDISKSVGFKENGMFCVAPIMTTTQIAKVEYWAAGSIQYFSSPQNINTDYIIR